MTTKVQVAERWVDRWWRGVVAKYDAVDITLGGSLLVHTGAYWGSGLLLLLLERAFPGFAARYKTQPGRTVKMRDLLKLLKRVLTNQAILLAGFLLIRKVRPQPIVDRAEQLVRQPVPSLARVVKDYVFNLGVFEVVFYVLHRALHDQRWYRHIHKIHHEFKYPIALASEYAHFIELMMSNVIPGAVGPAITNAHPLSTFTWLTGSILMTNFHHSGMNLPFYPLNYMTRAHDWHHLAFTDQFGVVGAMDTVLKTTGGNDFHAFASEIVKRVGFGY
jgi:sterol desaturase/sphingolipid hydroxylase (fatty acid hydroxylase superfamily)